MSEGTRFDVPCMTVDVFDYPYTDFEGDPCRLARFELQLPKVDLCWFPQRTTVWGFMSELRANPKLTRNHDDGGFAYIPEPDKTFRPGLVKLVIDQ